jgi:hypothetical protein
LEPLKYAAELRQHTWPGRVGRVTIEVVCESTKDTAAVTWHAPTVAEKMDTTVEELRAALERVPSVIM